jgi:hypothetical protein
MIPHRPILKGVPIPSKLRPNRKISEFGPMEVGDAKDFHGTHTERGNWQSLASAYGRQTGKKFTSRSIASGGEIFIRIWRIE